MRLKKTTPETPFQPLLASSCCSLFPITCLSVSWSDVCFSSAFFVSFIVLLSHVPSCNLCHSYVILPIVLSNHGFVSSDHFCCLSSISDTYGCGRTAMRYGPWSCCDSLICTYLTTIEGVRMLYYITKIGGQWKWDDAYCTCKLSLRETPSVRRSAFVLFRKAQFFIHCSIQ